MLSAKGTKAGTVEWSGHYLVDPWMPNGQLVDLNAYPKLAAYYEANADALRKRNIAGRYDAFFAAFTRRIEDDRVGIERQRLLDPPWVIPRRKQEAP